MHFLLAACTVCPLTIPEFFAQTRLSDYCGKSFIQREKMSRIPPILTYHHLNTGVQRILLDNFNVIADDTASRLIFPQPPMVAFRRDDNLRTTLVQTTVKQAATHASTYPCQHSRCRTCAEHFRSNGHNAADALVLGIKLCAGNIQRKKHEMRLIFRLGTCQPRWFSLHLKIACKTHNEHSTDERHSPEMSGHWLRSWHFHKLSTLIYCSKKCHAAYEAFLASYIIWSKSVCLWKIRQIHNFAARVE